VTYDITHKFFQWNNGTMKYSVMEHNTTMSSLSTQQQKHMVRRAT
jgi:hypothetical protein